MSNEILFRTQLASIMEVLANAAVEEICKLVDDGYAVVHLQMSEYQKENEALKVALHLMELKAARGCAERARAPENHLDPYSDGALTLRDKPRGTSKEGPTVAGNRVLGNPGDVCPQGFHPAVEEGNPVTTFSLKQVEPAGADNDRNTCILIKEEIPEGSSNAHADMKIPVQGALDSGTGEEDGVPALGLGVSAAECPQEHRAGRGTAVWEVSGAEAVLRLQAENMAAPRLGERAPLSARGSQCSTAAFRAPGQAPAQAPPRPFRGAELRPVPKELAGTCARPSPSDPEPRADGVVMDSVKEESVTQLPEWDKDPAPLRARHRDDRDAEEAPPGPVNPSSLPLVWPAGGEIATATCDSDAGGLDGLVACERDFGFAAGCNGSAKEKRFVCRFCGKGFTRLNALEIHQRVHTGEKPFRCAQCGKRFSDSSNHRRHQSVHTRERPFSCTQCERSFSHHYQLKVHQRVHTGDRPFCCVHCGKKFGERSFLKMHQQRDHAPLYVT
ncbi:zinc finger and BTB domain-containing protein 17-like isoform X1 [Anguilla rostrata]|uniref:zinc finger and BTB domain-containing protein 17-like isoform X1 n=1 Tax=Anguilla rostrata TaxID=7938 RepID=UPI0030D40FD7